MSKELYKKYLSTGFADLNQQNRMHLISLYQENYSSFLPKDKKAQILEVGCGMGFFLEFIAGHGYENYLGVDISPEAIEYCQDRGIKKTKLIKDLEDFLTSSATGYDFIILNDVIEHLEQKEVLPVLTKAYERLNSGGQIIVKTGNLASLVGPRIRFNDFTHFLGFTEYSLKQVLIYSKFRDIVIYPYKFPKNRITRVIRYLGQKVVHAIWKMVYFFEFTEVPKVVDEQMFAIGKKK